MGVAQSDWQHHAYNGTSKALTVTAVTEAPANTDAFVIS